MKKVKYKLAIKRITYKLDLNARSQLYGTIAQ